MKTVTGANGKAYKVTTQTVGQRHGVVGIVKALNGRVIHATVPYASEESALRNAEKWAVAR